MVYGVDGRLPLIKRTIHEALTGAFHVAMYGARKSCPVHCLPKNSQKYLGNNGARGSHNTHTHTHTHTHARTRTHTHTHSLSPWCSPTRSLENRRRSGAGRGRGEGESLRHTQTSVDCLCFTETTERNPSKRTPKPIRNGNGHRDDQRAQLVAHCIDLPLHLPGTPLLLLQQLCLPVVQLGKMLCGILPAQRFR